MKITMHFATLAVLCLASASHAANIYMMSSGDTSTDSAATLALTSRGNTVVLGVPYTAFDGSVNLTGIDTVYLQANANWTTGAMPVAGQQQLISWVHNGGRLVTSEWVVYFSGAGSNFGVLAEILPAVASGSYGSSDSTTMTLATSNPTIRTGVPAIFTCPLTNYAGTETNTVAKGGASTYFTSAISPGAAGLMGWRVGNGFAYSFTTTCGPNQTADANFGQLFANVMNAMTPPCESGDFDGDGDVGTDADIEAFFRCLSGNCCATCPQSSDFNGDGDVGTDADIEAFFRVLAGGGC